MLLPSESLFTHTTYDASAAQKAAADCHLQVFCFIMKEKGTSWAYATPGFGASLSASNLRQLRQLTGTLTFLDMGLCQRGKLNA